MNELVKYALIGIGGYLIYQNYLAPAPAAQAAPQTTTPPPPTAGKALLQQWAASEPDYQVHGTLNAYQWNWGYAHVRGTNPPDPVNMGIADPNMQLTFEEYWTRASSAGLTGLGAYRRAWSI